MHQKDAVRAAWAAAGLYDSKDGRLQQALAAFEEAPLECWPDLARRIRANFPECIEALVKPLWMSGDKLVRVNLIRHADLARPEERQLLEKAVRTLSKGDLPEFSAVVNTATQPIVERLLKRKDLPEQLRAIAQRRKPKP